MSHLPLVVGIGKVLFFPWAMLSLQHCCRNSLCSQGLQESFWTAFLTTGPARNFLQLKSISWPRFFLKFLDVWLPIVWGFHRWLNLFQSHKLCSRNDGVLSEQIFFPFYFYLSHLNWDLNFDVQSWKFSLLTLPCHTASCEFTVAAQVEQSVLFTLQMVVMTPLLKS